MDDKVKTDSKLPFDDSEIHSMKGDYIFAACIMGLIFGAILGIIWWGNVKLGYLPGPIDIIKGWFN